MTTLDVLQVTMKDISQKILADSLRPNIILGTVIFSVTPSHKFYFRWWSRPVLFVVLRVIFMLVTGTYVILEINRLKYFFSGSSPTEVFCQLLITVNCLISDFASFLFTIKNRKEIVQFLNGIGQFLQEQQSDLHNLTECKLLIRRTYKIIDNLNKLLAPFLIYVSCTIVYMIIIQSLELRRNWHSLFSAASLASFWVVCLFVPYARRLWLLATLYSMQNCATFIQRSSSQWSHPEKIISKIKQVEKLAQDWSTSIGSTCTVDLLSLQVNAIVLTFLGITINLGEFSIVQPGTVAIPTLLQILFLCNVADGFQERMKKIQAKLKQIKRGYLMTTQMVVCRMVIKPVHLRPANMFTMNMDAFTDVSFKKFKLIVIFF